MSAEHLRRMKWIPVNKKLWKDLPMTWIISKKDSVVRFFYSCNVGENDLNHFIDDILISISEKSNISIEEVRHVFEDKNLNFYSLKDAIFEDYDYLYKGQRELKSLQKLLRIPDFDLVSDNLDNKSSVESILNEFYELNDSEKIDLLKELKLISVKIERLS